MTSVRWNGIDGHSVLSLRTPSSSSSGEYWDAVGELDEHELEVLMEEVDSMQCFDPPVCRAVSFLFVFFVLLWVGIVS